MSPEDLARLFHETYERLAPEHGYETRRASAVPWEQVPEQNKSLMVAVATEVLVSLRVHDRRRDMYWRVRDGLTGGAYDALVALDEMWEQLEGAAGCRSS